MFGLFRKKKKKGQKLPELYDLNQERLQEGDEVQAMRYNLGRAVLLIHDNAYYYRSIESGRQIRFHLMIDASTQRQKVEKIQPN